MSHDYLMQGMSVQHLRFTVRAIESITFSNQAGSALRGALYQALSNSFCSEPNGPITPNHVERCPVCWMLAAEHQEDKRGQDIPRPLTIEPPNEPTYHENTIFNFGLTLIGRAQDLLPYLARAIQKMGRLGLGLGRGRFKLENIIEINPMLDAERVLMERYIVKPPTLQITPPRVTEAAQQLNSQRITLNFLTPIRLTGNDKLVKQPDPVVFIQRLLERCQRLAGYYAETDTPPPYSAWLEVYHALSSHAEHVCIAADYTSWQEGWSGSRRQQRYTPVSGIVGTVRWEGDLSPLLPWLLWGQSLHVGKSVVKGNGWYQIVR